MYVGKLVLHEISVICSFLFLVSLEKAATVKPRTHGHFLWPPLGIRINCLVLTVIDVQFKHYFAHFRSNPALWTHARALSIAPLRVRINWV